MDREIPASERQRVLKKRLLKILLVAAAVIVSVVIVSGFFRTSIKRSDLAVGIVDNGPIETSVSGTGRVIPAFEQIINSSISSRIVEVYCKEGDTVSEGTPLLRLDLQSAESEIKRMADERRTKELQTEQTNLNNRTYLSDLEMQVKVKEMNVNRLREDAANERRLDSIGSGTGERVRQAELAYATGCLELEQLRKQLENEQSVRQAEMKMRKLELSIFDKEFNEKQRTFEDARLKSPRKATLTYINNQIGRQVSPGEKVAVIADLSHFKVAAEISDIYADRVGVGAHVVVKSGSTTLNGLITNVTPLSKNGIISFAVALDDDAHPRLRSGLKTDVHVLCEIHDNVVRIPAGPYFKGPGQYDLFVVGDNELTKRKVQLGDSNYEFVEVVSGLQPGEKIVTSDMSEYQRKSKITLK